MLFASGALRLCGEMFESLSAIIGENLRLKILCTSRFGAKNFCITDGILYLI
jgi:hypothetical protein